MNWGAGVEETLREKESIRKSRNRRRHSVDDLDSDDGVSKSPAFKMHFKNIFTEIIKFFSFEKRIIAFFLCRKSNI